MVGLKEAEDQSQTMAASLSDASQQQILVMLALLTASRHQPPLKRMHLAEITMSAHHVHPREPDCHACS